MALMQCPECKEQISEHAEACPICGFPMKKHLKKQGHFGLQEEEADTASESTDDYDRGPAQYPRASSKQDTEHHEAGCVFSGVSFGLFVIWLYILILTPTNMTLMSVALFCCTVFYLKKPSFFSENPDPRHKSMSFIFAIYFLLSTIFGIAIIFFNIKIPLPF